MNNTTLTIALGKKIAKALQISMMDVPDTFQAACELVAAHADESNDPTEARGFAQLAARLPNPSHAAQHLAAACAFF